MLVRIVIMDLVKMVGNIVDIKRPLPLLTVALCLEHILYLYRSSTTKAPNVINFVYVAGKGKCQDLVIVSTRIMTLVLRSVF